MSRAAEAQLENGVLHICLPKLNDRRGGEFIVEVKEIGKESTLLTSETMLESKVTQLWQS